MSKTDLSTYDNSWYHPEAGMLKRTLWHFVNHLFFTHGFLPVSSLKVWILRAFGARVGKGVNIKPSINIKYPWLMEIGDYVWIGEKVWIDNLAKVVIGNNVCLSQGATLLTGNHDFTKSSFDLKIGEITLEEGVWIGARAVVYGGITCKSHSILGINSVAENDLRSYIIYKGNPAIPVLERKIK